MERRIILSVTLYRVCLAVRIDLRLSLKFRHLHMIASIICSCKTVRGHLNRHVYASIDPTRRDPYLSNSTQTSNLTTQTSGQPPDMGEIYQLEMHSTRQHPAPQHSQHATV